MTTLSLRGLLAPAFFAMAIAAGILAFGRGPGALIWLSLGFTALGLAFAPDARRLFNNALSARREL